jgi:TatD DNase family protein
MLPSLCDAHCHLADLPDPEAALAEAAAAGVSRVIGVSMGPADAARVLDLKRGHPDRVLAGVGLHPSRVPGLDDAAIESELALAARRALEADVVGEIGLDHKDAADGAQRLRQRAVLERMLDIAERSRRPVNLHTRRADRDLLGIAALFTRRTGLHAVMHWFTHSAKLARACGEVGLFISAGPSILTDPRQAEAARAIHPDFLLVETDAPVFYAGRAAAPSWAAEVCRRLASDRGEDREAWVERLDANLRRYLGGPAPPASSPSR